MTFEEVDKVVEDAFYSKSALEDVQVLNRITDELVQEYHNRYSSKVNMEKYLNPVLNDEYQQAKQKREEAALTRNQFGEVLYSSACDYCTEHYDNVETCNLCGIVWPYERLHKAINNSDWQQSLMHNCVYTRRVLQLILKAVRYNE